MLTKLFIFVGTVEMAVPTHELFLRVWIAIVAFMALGNTFAIFFGTPTFLRSKLYNAKPDECKLKLGGSSPPAKKNNY